jgi:hypothetical protein
MVVLIDASSGLLVFIRVRICARQRSGRRSLMALDQSDRFMRYVRYDRAEDFPVAIHPIIFGPLT